MAQITQMTVVFVLAIAFSVVAFEPDASASLKLMVLMSAVAPAIGIVGFALTVR
jgi:hypothetical protein